jgi:murein DD-endopeptidase MepM/ murein hydrolase activator NlpD
MTKNSQPSRLFKVISWAVTGVIVLALLGLAVQKFLPPAPPALLVATPTGATGLIQPVTTSGDGAIVPAIIRRADLKTTIPTRQPYAVVDYTVGRGDSLFGIAAGFNIKPETLYWANYAVFGGSPDSLVPGDVLHIPPVDGVYYKWQEGDTFESVADEFGIAPETILDWPGNNIDLTDPQIPVGGYVMVPDGKKTDQPLFITTVTRFTQACGGGYIGRSFFTWPTAIHTLSGYDFGDNGGSHKGIDITATEGSPIYAANNGVVTMAGWSQYGYGNVIQIDHGDGFVTLYAHLSAFFVKVCDGVLAHATIGAAGNTGNSSGTHLHFEIRYNGVAQNPWFYLP